MARRFAGRISQLLVQSRKGNVKAQFAVGFVNYVGWENLTPNYGMAEFWLGKAAKRGHPLAAYWLGRMYAIGPSKYVNKSAARKWFRIAIERGNTDGHYGLSLVLEGLGKRGSADWKEALRQLQLGAIRGSVKAQTRLAAVYDLGELGVAKDIGAALHWYRKAAEAHDIFGVRGLTFIYSNPRSPQFDPIKGLIWITIHSSITGDRGFLDERGPAILPRLRQDQQTEAKRRAAEWLKTYWAKP